MNRILQAAVACVLAFFTLTASGAIITVGQNARYIQVVKTTPTNSGDANRFHIGEIEAFLTGVAPAGGIDNANDQALSGLGAVGSTVSGTPQHGADSNLVSGVVNTGGGTWSRQNPLPIVAQVDLGAVKDIGQVRVWQRGDGCCQQRLNDFEVVLLDASSAELARIPYGAQVATNSFGSLDFTSTHIMPGNTGTIGTETVTGATGRYIDVASSGRLHVGEIEAFLAGVTPGAGIDNANDQALSSLGAIGSTLAGSVQHGADSNLVSGVLNGGGATWSRTGASTAGVDLGQDLGLGEIRVWQRGDGCCQDRQANYFVRVYSGGESSADRGVLLFEEHMPGQTPTNSFSNFSLADAFAIDADDILFAELDGATKTADLFSIGTAGDGALFIESGATLEVAALSSPFISGDVFDVLDFGTVVGEFGTLNLPALAGGLAWDTSNLYLDGTLAVVPEPSRAALLGLGLAALLMRRRRR